jgi:hypothetical protein
MSLIIPANSLAGGGYQVDNSLRFNSGSSDYLVLADGTPTDALKWTYSTWVKRSALGGSGAILGGYQDGNNWTDFYFTGGNELELTAYISSSTGITVNTNARFRDVSAWYHIVLVYDSANGTASNRVKIYVNEVLQTINTATYPSLNYATKINASGVNQNISFSAQAGFNGYIAETYFIDGQALTPTDFGEFDEDSGIWKPIAYTGTYGTNGFFLEFQDSGALGTDTSGEGNNFTVNNLTSIDQTTDTPTNNFATLNPLQNLPSLNTYSEGNNTVTYTVNNDLAEATFGVTTGKYYWEQKYIDATGGNAMIGVGNEQAYLSGYLGQNTTGWSYYAPSGGKYHNASTSAYGDSYTTNDIIGIAFDADTRTIWFSKNGVWQNSATIAEISSGTTTNSAYTSMGSAGDLFLPVTSGYNGNVISFNFGNAPYTITTGNADANSFGNFEYEVPAGYLALCTANLSEVNS